MQPNIEALKQFLMNPETPSNVDSLAIAITETNYQKLEADIWSVNTYYDPAYSNGSTIGFGSTSKSDDEIEEALTDLDSNQTNCLDWLAKNFGATYVANLKQVTYDPVNLINICIEAFNEFLEYPGLRYIHITPDDLGDDWTPMTDFFNEHGLKFIPDVVTDWPVYLEKYGLYIAFGGAVRGFFTWSSVVFA